MICSRSHGLLFEDDVTTARCDRYNLMCSIEDHEIYHRYINDEASSGGGIPLTFNSTIYYLISFGITLNFIDGWIK